MILCWFESPGRRLNQQETLHARVLNLSQETYADLPVRLFINDTLKAINPITINPNESLELELSYQNNFPGTYWGKVELDDYPVVFDNSFYYSYEVQEKINALAIDKTGEKQLRTTRKTFYR